MDVVDKELLPQMPVVDLIHETQILLSLYHPNLPYSFGVCTKTLPLYLVMQFHGFRSEMKSRCSCQDLEQLSQRIILLFAHILEAVHYLHNEAKILHNNITLNNTLMSQCENHGCSENLEHQVIRSILGKQP